MDVDDVAPEIGLTLPDLVEDPNRVTTLPDR